MKFISALFLTAGVAWLSGCTTPSNSTYGNSSGYSTAQGRQVVSAQPTPPGYNYGYQPYSSNSVPTYPTQGAASAQQSGTTAGTSDQSYQGSSSSQQYSTSGSSSSQNQPSEADRALVSQIRNQLDQYGTLAQVAPSVNLDSHYGTVTLRGSVPTEREKQMILALVRTTPGVVSVNDQLTVAGAGASSPTGSSSTRVYSSSSDQNNSPASGSTTGSATTINTPATGDMFSLHVQGLNDTDRQVAQRIIDGLRSDSSLSQLVPKVNIDVSNGQVTLRGNVQNEQQRQTIASAVQRATGTAINDQLQIAEPGNQPR